MPVHFQNPALFRSKMYFSQKRMLDQHHIPNLRLVGCPIEDYSLLLWMNPLDYLEIDENAVAAHGMDNLVKHHPDVVIEVKKIIDNRKVQGIKRG